MIGIEAREDVGETELTDVFCEFEQPASAIHRAPVIHTHKIFFIVTLPFKFVKIC